MAVLIAQRWSLGVLRVTLDEAPEVPTVSCEVIVNDGPQHEVRLSRQLPIWSFGLEDTLDRQRARELHLSVPPELVADLAGWVRGGMDDRAVLWIHLVKPYGVLGAVPWEQMQASIGIPVLRLPDVLPDQAPPEGTVDIAVCAVALERKGELPLLEVASQIMIAAGSLTDVRVHFFVDQQTAEELTDHLGAGTRWIPKWSVHRWDPAREADTSTAPRRHRREERATNRWLAWIQDAARGQSFDVLHFACHGYVTGRGDRGVLALPVSPEVADFQAASHVAATDVLDTARAVGAFAVGFSSLPGNYSTTGMRLVADAVGANRAGPVFMYDHLQGDGSELEYAYQLILGRKLDFYPENASLLFYLQPDLVRLDKQRAREEPNYGVTFESMAAAEVEGAFPSLTPMVTRGAGAGAENPPPWASVLARFVDEKRSDLKALKAEQSAGTLDEERRAYLEGVEQALRHLDDVVTRHTMGPS